MLCLVAEKMSEKQKKFCRKNKLHLILSETVIFSVSVSVVHLCLFRSASVWLPWNSVKIFFVDQETDTENGEHHYAIF